MKLKSLIKNFSYDAILNELPKQGWRLPTLKEARELQTEHSAFWIQAETKIHDDRLHIMYNVLENRVNLVNKHFMLPTAVIPLPSTCDLCRHQRNGMCRFYDFNIRVTTGVPVQEFGCIPNFNRRK